MKTALSFDDVLLVPRYNDIESRDDVSLETSISGLALDIPIIAANMPSVCGRHMAMAMAEQGGLGIIHRMQAPAEQQDDVLYVSEEGYPVGAAVGVALSEYNRGSSLVKVETDILCVDVAHGHQERTLKMALSLLRADQRVIVGNIATAEAAEYFDREIPDEFQDRVSLKVGVGGGSVCKTRIQTGFGVPTLQSVMDVSAALEDSSMSIIADGGFRNSGDIVKALAAGADAVMLGSLLAGTHEAPGNVIYNNQKQYKIYRGAASRGEKKDFFGKADYIEGEEMLVPYKGFVEDVLKELTDGIRSGLTYCGVDNIVDLHNDAEFIRITQAGYQESVPHGLLWQN